MNNPAAVAEGGDPYKSTFSGTKDEK